MGQSVSRSTCMICTNHKFAMEMFTSMACSHSYCTTCICQHIKAKLQLNIPNINCPDPDCNAPLDPLTCRSFLSKETLDRWGDALCEAAIVGMQKFFCPFPDCSVTMIFDHGEKEGVTAAECMSCRRMFCAQCKVGWHGDMTCEEFVRNGKASGIVEDMKAMELAEKNKWKKCPHCRIYVSKIDGCNRMKCRCGAQFCYSCGGEWSFSHVFHM